MEREGPTDAENNLRLSFIGIPHFLQVHTMPLGFYGRPTLEPDFANQKKSKEEFRFYKERQKLKTVFSVCFVASHSRGSTPRVALRMAPRSIFSRNHTQHAAPSHQSFEFVSEHLRFILIFLFFCATISKMCLRVSGKSKRGYFWGL